MIHQPIATPAIASDLLAASCNVSASSRISQYGVPGSRPAGNVPEVVRRTGPVPVTRACDANVAVSDRWSKPASGTLDDGNSTVARPLPLSANATAVPATASAALVASFRVSASTPMSQ